MDDVVNSAERLDGSAQLPTLVLVERLTLTRTCILNILKRELLGFEILDIASTDDLNCASGRDIRLVALGIGDKPVDHSSVEDDLALLVDYCPGASVALLSNRDDEATAVAAMHRGVRGYFPSSLPIEVVVAGLRLVLAGGVYRPLPILGLGARALEQSGPGVPLSNCVASDAERRGTENNITDFTPREQQVLAELELGSPNKVIAAKLNLSENTVKMHVQHIMRKCAARNRTQAVLRWSGRLANCGRDTHARTP